MQQHSNISISKPNILFFTGLCGLSTLVFLFAVDIKWLAFLFTLVALAVFLLFINLATNKLYITILLLAFFSLPIFYDVNFLFRDNVHHFVFANGFTINAFDLFFYPLFFYWLFTSRDELKFSGSLAIYCLAGFLVLNGLSTLYTGSSFFSVSAMFWFVKAYCVFYYFYNQRFSSQTWVLIVRAIVVVIFIQGLVAVEQKLLGKIFTEDLIGSNIGFVSLVGLDPITRVAGFLSHPNNFAMFLNLFIPICMLMLSKEPSKPWRYLYILAILLALVAEVWTASRGGWVGLVAALCFAFPLLMIKKGTNLLKIVVFGTLVTVSTFATVFTASETVRNRITGEDYGTAELRFSLMEVAFNMISHHPSLGVGLNRYAEHMQSFDNSREFVSKYYGYPVHNTYLLIAAETGVFSLFLFSLFLLIVVVHGVKGFFSLDELKGRISLGLTAGLVSWMVHNLVNLDAIYLNTMLWIIFGSVLALYRFNSLSPSNGFDKSVEQ